MPDRGADVMRELADWRWCEAKGDPEAWDDGCLWCFEREGHPKLYVGGTDDEHDVPLPQVTYVTEADRAFVDAVAKSACTCPKCSAKKATIEEAP